MTETNAASIKPSVDQIGIVVRDLHGMVATLKLLLGIDDFRIMEWPIEGIDPKATYHGEPGNFKVAAGIRNCRQYTARDRPTAGRAEHLQ